MNPNVRMLGVWSGALFFVLFLIGYGALARWIPPFPATMTAEEVAHLFHSRSTMIILGMVFMIIGATFYLPWTMLISDLIKQKEGKSYFLSGTQLVSGVVSMMTFFIPPYFWVTAAFRAERDANLVQLLTDQGWLMFITAVPPFIIQYISLAIAIFIDDSPIAVFPRWAAYLQIWISLSFIPAFMAFFMKTGPFAWNGLFVWWIPLSIFTIWFIAMIGLCRKAVLRSVATLN